MWLSFKKMKENKKKTNLLKHSHCLNNTYFRLSIIKGLNKCQLKQIFRASSKGNLKNQYFCFIIFFRKTVS